MTDETAAYRMAQGAIADLKAAVITVLEEAPATGLSNADIGRTLGIYEGYAGGNEGHISRTILGILEHERLVEQDSKTKLWKRREIGRRRAAR